MIRSRVRTISLLAFPWYLLSSLAFYYLILRLRVFDISLWRAFRAQCWLSHSCRVLFVLACRHLAVKSGSITLWSLHILLFWVIWHFGFCADSFFYFDVGERLPLHFLFIYSWVFFYVRGALAIFAVLSEVLEVRLWLHLATESPWLRYVRFFQSVLSNLSCREHF